MIENFGGSLLYLILFLIQLLGLSFQRLYTHVKPILSLKKAINEEAIEDVLNRLIQMKVLDL